jgi:hypothetical protein
MKSKWYDELMLDDTDLVVFKKPKPRVYLAGKIQANCWRHDLVPGLRGHDWAMGDIDTDDFSYVGPFFVSCDHRCYHVANSHGAGDGCSPSFDLAKKQVALKCRSALARADLLFCFINTLDCYGTIAEIERAATLGVRIEIAFAHGIVTPQDNDMWFVCESADKIHYNVCECKLMGLLKASLRSCHDLNK